MPEQKNAVTNQPDATASTPDDGKPQEVEFQIPIGASGTQFFKGMFNISDNLEYVNDLKGRKAIETYNRMRRSDGQVKAVLLALTHPIVDANWDIQEPEDASAKEKEATEKLREWWFNSEFAWEDTLRKILSFFWAGFSVHEKLYKFDKDGYIVPDRLAQRLQSTIVEWKIDPSTEQLLEVKQLIDGGDTRREVWIPANKLAIFTFDKEGDDYRGQSPLRPAYKHFYYKEAFERLQAIQLERWGIGIPKVKQTGAVVGGPNKDKAIAAAKNLGAHEQAYVWEPFGLEISILDAGSSKQIDMKPAIDYHNLEIARSILAQFTMLGQTDSGARSVGETLKDMYLKGLAFSANYICEVINASVFKDLCQWNWGDIRVPKLTCDGIQPMELELLSTAYSNLARDGVVTMDDPTEDYIRKKVGLPTMDKTTSRRRLPVNSDVGNNNSNNDSTQQMRDHKCDTKCGHVKFMGSMATMNPAKDMQDIPVPSTLFFWRPLRDNEKIIALREISGHMDDSREKIVEYTSQTRSAIIDDLIKQVVAAAKSNDPAQIQAIDYTDAQAQELSSNMMDVLNEVVQYGREQVDRELTAQSGKISLSFPGSKKDAAELMQKFLKSKADHSTEISLDKIVDQARVEAGTAMRTGTVDPADIRDALENFSENTVRKAANYTIGVAFSFGRQQEAELRKGDIEYAEYSAILDQNTCRPCERLDGTQVQVDSPEYDRYSPPLSDCEGGDQCRCLWIYILKPSKGE